MARLVPFQTGAASPNRRRRHLGYQRHEAPAHIRGLCVVTLQFDDSVAHTFEKVARPGEIVSLHHNMGRKLAVFMQDESLNKRLSCCDFVLFLLFLFFFSFSEHESFAEQGEGS